MEIIEATASRSFTLKVAKADYKGEERYRPNEDVMVHAGLKASLAPGEDAAAARRTLQALVEEDVRLGVEAARAEARRRLHDATDPKPVATITAAPPAPEQLHELRRLATRLAELSKEPATTPPPKTREEADALAKQLRGAIYDYERKAPRRVTA